MGGPGWQRKPKEHKMQLKTGDKGTFHQCKAADGARNNQAAAMKSKDGGTTEKQRSKTCKVEGTL